MFVMICYDVPAKRTEIFKKILKEFLIHEQASVFMGDLPESALIKLEFEISKKIGPDDKIIQLICRNRHNVSISRLQKSQSGGQMSQVKDTWHGKDWTIL